MTHYWVYQLDDQGGIVSSSMITAVSDAEASFIAHLMLHDADLELWQGRRLIAKLFRKGPGEPGALVCH